MSDNTLGSKLVRNTALGAAGGAVVGVGVGAWKVHQETQKVPTDTVTLGGYEKPVMQKVNLGTESWVSADSHSPYWGSGANTHNVSVDAPVKNADGSIKMEHIPPREVTDHGKAIVGTKQVPIKEPVNVRTGTSTMSGSREIDGVTYPYVDVHNYVRYDMNTVGHYTEPTVRFETGVNTAGIILTNMALFSAIGGALGAAATIVAERVK